MIVVWFPACLLAHIALLLDTVFYYLFGFLFTCCTCRWGEYSESLKAIRVFRSGPSVWRHPVDLFVAVLGQTNRQGVLEMTFCFANMLLVIPWLKWFVNANPWVYKLDIRFMNQISTSVKDVGLHNVVKSGKIIVTRVKQTKEMASMLDELVFVPHYPLPPPWRRWALGMQQAPWRTTLVVSTTHSYVTNGGSTEQFVLSNSCLWPVWRVMLWYNNPYHFHTGFVEASIATAMPSQPSKKFGGEHPMWCISSHSPMNSSRDGYGLPGIDAFFDQWLPTLFSMQSEFFYPGAGGSANFERLVIGYIEADFCE